jgi:hypothetical protein
MINITEGTRNNPSVMTCECGQVVNMAIHHDFIEGGCLCGKFYCIPMVKSGVGIWNCCSEPENGCGYECKNKIHSKR